ncbi:MAG: GDSL-type esterase/lipase family protein [Fibrobacteria bacterium]
MKTRPSIPISVAICCALAVMSVQAQIKVACVGNSITAGGTLSNPGSQGYPARLGALLGSGYTVRAEGRSGAYMQKAGRSPYWTTSQFKDVFAFKPAIITICLGTNDARATQWNRARYIADYKTMIDTFSTISPKPKIWLVKVMPAWYATDNSTVKPSVPGWSFDNGIAGNGISGFTIRDSVNPAVDQVAKEKGLPVIDLYTPMLMGKPFDHTVTPSFVSDGVHPNPLGHDTIAHVIYRAMLAGPTALSPLTSKSHPAFTKPLYFTGLNALPAGLSVSASLYTLDGKSRPHPVTPLSAGVYVPKGLKETGD